MNETKWVCPECGFDGFGLSEELERLKDKKIVLAKLAAEHITHCGRYQLDIDQLVAERDAMRGGMDEAREVMLASEAVYTRDNVRAWLAKYPAHPETKE